MICINFYCDGKAVNNLTNRSIGVNARTFI